MLRGQGKTVLVSLLLLGLLLSLVSTTFALAQVETTRFDYVKPVVVTSQAVVQAGTLTVVEVKLERSGKIIPTSPITISAETELEDPEWFSDKAKFLEENQKIRAQVAAPGFTSVTIRVEGKAPRLPETKTILGIKIVTKALYKSKFSKSLEVEVPITVYPSPEEKLAALIVASRENIETTTKYIDYAQNTIIDAKNLGLDVGEEEETLRTLREALDIEAEEMRRAWEIGEQTTLITLEERIRRCQEILLDASSLAGVVNEEIELSKLDYLEPTIISLEPTGETLQPGTTVEMRVKLQEPKGERPYYPMYAVITAETELEEPVLEIECFPAGKCVQLPGEKPGMVKKQVKTGFKGAEIFVRGVTPNVLYTKRVTLLKLTTSPKYRGLEQFDQVELNQQVVVTTPSLQEVDKKLLEAEKAIQEAKERIKKIVDNQKRLEMEKELRKSEEYLKIAEDSYKRGEPEIAKNLAQQAIDKANKIFRGQPKPFEEEKIKKLGTKKILVAMVLVLAITTLLILTRLQKQKKKKPIKTARRPKKK
ncbi:MAG: hypothetical protein DRO11_06955 [Methanobacteriota archaeon]|nr:MAG: hypothetical protein DRO11_06955 [Euryarchaeota archaeon]